LAASKVIDDSSSGSLEAGSGGEGGDFSGRRGISDSGRIVVQSSSRNTSVKLDTSLGEGIGIGKRQQLLYTSVATSSQSRGAIEGTRI
jgi:hypothetical protein